MYRQTTPVWFKNENTLTCQNKLSPLRK